MRLSFQNKQTPSPRRMPAIAVVALLLALVALSSCAAADTTQGQQQEAHDQSRYLVSVIDEPATTDFQCTTIDYTVALNVFNRLVETWPKSDNSSVQIVPSLAKSWEVSDDGLTYTFHLRDDVTFSNGSALTSSDVRYTFVRLLTNPNSTNQDIVSDIKGARRLAAGKADDLEGFAIVDDHTFKITLEQPFSAFLACLCMPGASILDEQSTQEAGELFGKDPAKTVGTGAFVFEEWLPGEKLLLAANPNCWEGAPSIEGLDLRFVSDPNTLSTMVEQGQIDILNVDDLGELSNYFLHGSAHAQHLRTAPQVGIDYIALNESVRPLDDVRVRKALQLSLNRQALLLAAYGGSGRVEDGIYPVGLYGHNPNLAPIPYDADEARRLLDEAGLGDGFDLTITMRSTTAQWQRELVNMVASMWARVGVRAQVEILGEEDFMERRTAGKLACYTASWSADYDDPDNFVYTFFGSRDNTVRRSLCYGDEKVMERVRAARSILDEQARLREYRDLERKIVQEDAAWIPLFSRERSFLLSDRVVTFVTSWNGWFETSYKYISMRDA